MIGFTVSLRRALPVLIGILIPFSAWSAPAITGVGFNAPAHAQVGQTVLIYAEGLTGAIGVFFSNGTTPTVSATPIGSDLARGTILVKVPAGAATGNMKITAAGVDSNLYYFRIDAGTFTQGTRTVSGTVTNGASPVANVALLLLQPGTCQRDTIWDTAFTNASGNYAMTGVDGSFFIFTFNPVALGLANTSAPVTLSATPATQNFSLVAGTTVTGKVVDVGTLAPIATARLEIDGNGYETALSNATGDFSVQLPPGNWTFNFLPPSVDIAHAYVQLNYTIGVGPAQPLGNQPLANGVRISGSITHTGDGKPLTAKQLVRAQISTPCCTQGDQKGTDGAGNYNLIVPAGSTINVQVQFEADTSFIDGSSTVVVGSSNVVQNFVIQDAGIISGTVLDKLGAPVVGLGVEAVLAATPYSPVARDSTCNNGSYRLRVPPSLAGYLVYTSYGTPPYYASQTWNNSVNGSYFRCEGVTIPVAAAGTIVSGTNFSVPLAATVQGAVTSANSGCTANPYGFVNVDLDDGVSHSCNLGNNASNPPPGMYQIELLPPNTVMPTLRACVTNIPTAQPQCYNLQTPPAFTPITTANPGTTVTGINFCMPSCSPPPVPTGLTGTPNCSGISLNWSASAGATGYSILRGTTCPGVAGIGTSGASNYFDSTAAAGTTYSYAVQAMSNCGSSVSSACTAAGPILAAGAPTAVSASNACSNVVISWTNGVNATSHDLQRYNGACPSAAGLTTFTGVSSPYNDTAAVQGSSYCYLAVAKNASCGPSQQSAGVTGTWLMTPQTPAAPAATGTCSNIGLTWAAVPMAASYNILRGASCAALAQLGTSTTPSFTDATSSAGSTYFYALQAVNACGVSLTGPCSNGASWSPLPGAPAGVATTGNSFTQITTTWTNGIGATSSNLLRYNGACPSAAGLTTITGVTSPYNDTTAAAGSSYCNVVQSQNSCGTTNAAGVTGTRLAPLLITNPSLANGEVGLSYSQNLAASGGSGGYVWNVVSGLPAGLTLSGAGLLSGSPPTSGAVSLTVRVADSLGNSTTRNYPFTIFTPPAIATLSLPNGEVNLAYSQILSATGGSGGNIWSVAGGAMPSGLGLSAGVLTGTPASSSSANLTLRVTDSLGGTATQAYSFTIYPALTVTTASLPAGAVGTAYSLGLTASGGSGGRVWSVSAGLTPSGLVLGAGSGTLSGTPQASGSFSFTVQVTDSLTAVDSRPFTMSITQPLAILNANLAQGVIQDTYPFTALTAAGGTPPYTFSLLSGPLPPGIVLTGSNGQLSGKPTQIGSFPVNFQVTDSTTATASRSYTMTVVDRADRPNWTPRGQFGGKIQAIHTSPDYANDQTLFVMSEAGELFRSANKGSTWNRTLVKPSRAYNYANRFLLSPVFTNSVAATTPEQKSVFFSSYDIGVWKSVDQGATYSPVNSGLPCVSLCGTGGGPRVIGLAISPNYTNDRTLWAATFDNRIYRTSDGGASWLLMTTIVLAQGGLDTLFAVSPSVASDRTLFLAINNFVYRSTDNGATWTSIYTVLDTGNPKVVKGLAISPNYAVDHTLILEAENFHLYRTRNGGTSFSDLAVAGVALGQHLSAVARSGQTPLWYMESSNPSSFLYRLLYSEDAGTTFTPLYAIGMSKGNDVSYALEPSPYLVSGSDFFYGTEQGLYSSADGGFSFNEQDQGLSANVVYSVAGISNVVAAGYKGGWFKSADKATSRVRLDAPNAAGSLKEVYFNAVSPDYANDHVVFLGDASTVMRSADGGQTFTPVLAMPATSTLYAFVPGFSGVTGTMYVGNVNGLYKSIDGGQNFALFSSLPPACSSGANPAIQGIAVSPNYATDQTIFVASAVSGGAGGLCKSVNGGATWTAVLNGAAQISGPIVISPIYNEAGANGPAKTIMIYDQRSTNGGATWTTATGCAITGITGTAFSPLYALDGTVFIFGDGICRSSDGGVSFAALGGLDEVKSRTITGLYLPPDFDGRNLTGAVAVASTNGSGVWQSNDGGRTFVAALKSSSLDATVNSIVRVPGGGGLRGVAGEGAPLVPSAAVAAGTILAATENQGVFQSDDGGVTFSQISKGLPANARTRAVAAPALSPTTPLTTVAGAGVWKYNGTAWVQQSGANLSTTGNYTSFLEDGTYLYATRADGISVRSSDGGLTWIAQDASQTDLVKMDFNAQMTPTFLGDPAAKRQTPSPNFASAVTATLWAVSQTGGPRYSANSGTNWIATPGTNDYPLPGGQTWSVIRALGINPASGSREILAGSTTGLFRTTDGGTTWRNVSGPGSALYATSRNFSAMVSTVTSQGTTDILVGATGATNGGVYLSGDGGEHWTQVNAGFDPANLSISSLIQSSCSGCPVQYYSGSYGGGMYTRTIAVTTPPTFPAVNGACFGTGCTCGAAPYSGPEQGGQDFKLCGSNFQAGAVVEFDGIGTVGSCTVTAGQIACTGATPRHVPGAVIVRVRNPDTRAGTLPQNYSYLTGAPRAVNSLRITKAASDANLVWTCSGCTAGDPARIFRGQNPALTLFIEAYNGGTGGAFTNLGAVSSAQNYFWSVE